MLTRPELSSILERAELAYLAVETTTGPMVTPLLFTIRDDRVWMVVPRSSAKVAAIGRNPVVGLAAGTPNAMAVVQGDARLVDLMRPQSLVSSLSETVRSPRALGSYLADNAGHLTGLLGPGLLAPRTVAALRPQRAVAVRRDEPLWSSGGWPAGAAPYARDGSRTARRADLRLGDAPAALARRTAEAGPVLVGWTTSAGPVVLPGTWDPERQEASVRTDLFAEVGCLPQARACLLFDATEGTSLDGKTGLVLRGRGSAHAGVTAGDGTAAITVRTERLSWWQGDEARTVQAG